MAPQPNKKTSESAPTSKKVKGANYAATYPKHNPDEGILMAGSVVARQFASNFVTGV